ncbi:hypothetical protein Ae201684P_001809 [Aphanomyces euteiches]|uniref:Uncharacterized protein n=1 Tax=Aphanomyces euteiches TaxID=100861 RepID=A0A6G0XKZ2_9STRA|nr:hypothetical protein Ae201684_003659 [Aphanomyces euteiches]KAH9084567.1 hypothetical protein Ae201684P_001809 [Aphanomyces euteiches]KAH9142848.1 hypothetical protein AeRB84_013109 [Aphanomyces euteiches]
MRDLGRNNVLETGCEIVRGAEIVFLVTHYEIVPVLEIGGAVQIDHVAAICHVACRVLGIGCVVVIVNVLACRVVVNDDVAAIFPVLGICHAVGIVHFLKDSVGHR